VIQTVSCDVLDADDGTSYPPHLTVATVRKQLEMDGGDSPSDGDLLDCIARRDATAFALLYARYSRAAYALAYRILAEPKETEDVVQDAFLNVWLHPLTHEYIQHTARSWLLAIVRHRARDYQRRRIQRDYQQRGLDDALLIPSSADTYEQAMRNVAVGGIHTALSRLPSEQRRVLVLAYINGYSHDEIAHLLDVPLGTVKGRLRLGLQKMRQHLDAQI